jgi:hypothetical protein
MPSLKTVGGIFMESDRLPAGPSQIGLWYARLEGLIRGVPHGSGLDVAGTGSAHFVEARIPKMVLPAIYALDSS